MTWDFTSEGMRLRWADVAADAGRRAIIEAGPATPMNALRVLYSVDGGPERATRGWPVGSDPETGLQKFAVNLPDVAPGRTLDWRPVLSHGAREFDPARKIRETAPKKTAGEGQLADTSSPSEAAELEDTSKPLFDFAPEYMYRIFAPFEAETHSVGVTPDGIRMHFQLKPGGVVRGPLFNGTILPVGGDWMRIRPDGIGIADVHAYIQPDSGGLLLTEYSGVCDFGEDAFDRIAAGHFPDTVPVRLTPRYLTSDPQWAWMNRIQGFSVGTVDLRNQMLQYDEYVARPKMRGRIHA